MVVNGDDTQIDLPHGQRSGLLDVGPLFTGVEDIAIVRLEQADVVRHPLVRRIVAAYDRMSRERHT
jgi:phosphate starvation-inducible PhoH-like protein